MTWCRALTGACLALAFFVRVGVIPARAEEPSGAAPSAETGTVAGVVIDKATGEPIIEAGVEVVGQGKTVKTDIDGKFRIRLPPGSYELRLFAPLYQGLRLKGLVVKANQVTKADASLPLAAGSTEVVEVIAQANKAAEATQLSLRKKSAVVSDTVSAEVIKKSPDSDAAKIVQRAPAVTIRENKFVFVRGLGERYSSALLNGSRLPSTDPSKRVVPLDLFPADFLESIAIIKSYTPDLPGDFSGGLVDIHLREFPEQFTFSTGVATGGNTQTTFQNFRTYRGGSLDYLGLGTNFRQLPAGVPETGQFTQLNVAERDALGRTFKNIWNTHLETAPPNSGWNIAVGDTKGNFGYSLAGLYTTEYKTVNDRIERQFVNGGPSNPVALSSNFNVDNSIFETRLGGLLTTTYKLGDTGKLFFRSLIDRNTFDTTTFEKGTDTQGNPQQSTILRYTEEELDFGQVGGEHHWPWIWLDWRSAYSRTKQDEPDTRYITYKQTPPQYSTDSLGGDRVFNSLTEKLTDSQVDFTIPFTPRVPFTDQLSASQAKFKFGPAYSYRDRDFEQRRFSNNINLAAVNRFQPPEDVLDPSNIVPGIDDFLETTEPGDKYHVTQEIAGAYGMFDLNLVPGRWRLVSGVRMEYSYINLQTAAIGSNGPVQVIKNNLDPLPGANLIFTPRDDMNFRLSYSRSVSRPEFRELSPTQFPAPRGLRPLIGNPNLVESHIENYDARWEWFFSPLELISLSFFRKSLDKPIEQTVIVESSVVADSFANADNGELDGFEFEFRKDFGFVSPQLRNLSLVTNFTYVDATVSIPRQQLQVQTSTSRALQGQAPYIANGVLDYTNPQWGTFRLLYNTAGPTITSAGSFGLPDIFLQRRDELDAVVIFPIHPFGVPLTAKMGAENLLNDQFLYTQAGFVQRQFHAGIKVSFGLSYAY